MPRLNKYLVMSVIADIRECVRVGNEIYSWLGDIEHLSWKFPTKTAKDINAMEIVREHNGTAGEFYILLLELAYDRIQFVLRLIVEFMDKYPFIDDFFKEVTRVERSNHISLASLLQLVWNRLKTIPDSISRHMVKYGEDEDCFMHKVSRSSQADGNMQCCESCAMASETILQTVDAIEQVFHKNKLISAAATAKDGSRNDIYGSSQWAVMSRLTKGIGTDVETALRTMRESNLRAETARRDQEKVIWDLRADSTRQEKRADALQAKNLKLKGALENVEEELQKTWKRNIELERENEKLKESLGNTRGEISLLVDGSDVLQNMVATLTESKLQLEKTTIALRKEANDTREKQLETEQRFQILLDESRRETNSVTASCARMKSEHEIEMEKYREEIATLRSTITSQKQVIDSCNKTSQEEAILTPQDDPIADMTQQLIKNREKIEQLSRQNERLSKTLHRLREHRLTEKTVPNNSKK